MAGTSYTRQSTLTDGDTITASLFNTEYNQLVSAFAYASSGTTGHQHDGGAGEGGNIHTIGDQDFNNKIVVDSTNNRWSVYVEVGGSAVEQVRIEDGVVYPVTDSDVDLGTNALRFKDAYIDSLTATGNLTIGGNIDVDGTIEFDGLSGTGSVTVTDILDQDDMSGNSATALATQQSIKAYVDSQVTAQDLDLTDGSSSISIDLDSEALSVLGGTGIDSTASGNGVTLAIDSTVTTLTGSQTLTNKTLTSPDVNTPDIDGGTIDGAVIGGSSAAAGSFTTVGATGNITVGGTVDGRDVATDGTKLDGIEASATADQTDAEIRAAVEAATDSNVFTDADHTKLNAIEASADVTDTANVTAAGALMDSELTAIASVKALNQGVATTDSPTFAAVTVNGNVEFDGLSGTGSVTVTDILDQDDMSGNSATALATQQSIKAYVDAQQDTVDTLAEILALSNATGGSNIVFGDSSGATDDRLQFGASQDLSIYHDGSNSIIEDAGTGSLKIKSDGSFIDIQSNSTRINNAANNEIMATFVANGAVSLYHDNSTKLATNSGGISVTGEVAATSLDISGDIDVDGTTNLDVVDIDGAVDMASTLAVGGVVTANAGVVVDNFTLDGTTLALSSGDMTLDVAGNINLDADGGGIALKDGGTQYGLIFKNSNDLEIYSHVQDGDIKLRGNDGGSGIVALSLDMSNAGKATFNSGADFGADTQVTGIMSLYSTHLGAVIGSIGNTANDLNIYSTTSGHNGLRFHVNGILPTDNGGTIIDNDADLGDTSYRFKDLHLSGSIKNTSDITLDAAGHIILDADGGDFFFKDGGVTKGTIQNSSDDLVIKVNTQDKDLKFKGNDGGSSITALTLDMSQAGRATFNEGIVAKTSTAGAFGLTLNTASGDSMKLSVTDTGTGGGADGIMSVSDGDLTIDVAGDIILDADDEGKVNFKDGGTQYARIDNNGGTGLDVVSTISDGDIRFRGNDGGSTIEALTLDMSAAGSATFNNSIIVGNKVFMSDNKAVSFGAGEDLTIKSDGTNAQIATTNDIFIDAAGQISLDADNAGSVKLLDGGTFYGQFFESGNSFYIASKISDGDMFFQGNDGGSTITALTLDMSAAGTATFNSAIRATSATINSQLSIYTDGNGAELDNTSGNFTIDTAGDIILDADGGDVIFKHGGASRGHLKGGTSAQFELKSLENNADFVIKGIDNNAEITALTLNMSEAGAATFNSSGTFGGNLTIGDGGGVDLNAVGSRLQLSLGGTEKIRLASTEVVINEGSADLDFRVESDGNANMLLVNGGNNSVSVGTSTSEATFTVGGSATFNADSADADFRVESNNNANMLFVDGGNDAVGIGTGSPDRLLHLNTGITGAITSLLRLEGQFTSNSGNEGTAIEFVTGSGGTEVGARIIASRELAGAKGALRFCTGRETDAGFDNGNLVIASDGSLSTPTAGTSNVRFGVNAGNSIVNSGNYNVVVGDEAGTAITNGDNNVAIGYAALKTEDTGANSVAIGFNALTLQNNDAQNYNVAVGSYAGAAVTTGYDNTLIGGLAGDALDVGHRNVALGRSALTDDTKGNKSVAIGFSALNSQNFTSATDAYNTAIGYIAGYAVTTGAANTLIGGLAGDALTDADYNTVLGYNALSLDTLGSRSVAIGTSALQNQNFTSATDTYNVAVGFQSGASVTTATQNTLIGGLAGDAFTTGGANVALGYACLTSDTKGNNSVAIGRNALLMQNFTTATDVYNTAVGSAAGQQITTGVQNTLMGGLAGDALTDADLNVAIGYNAMTANTVGSQSVAVGSFALGTQNPSSAANMSNTAVGHSAGFAVTTGVQNTLIGGLAGDALTDADYNVAIGYAALGADTLGSRSVAIGWKALDIQNFTSATNAYNTAIGFEAGGAVTTGVENTLIGGLAGDALTDADRNTAVGYLALSSDTLGSNSVAIGRNALSTQNFTSATDAYNTAVGLNAGNLVTTGIRNTFVGGLAGDATDDGNYNVAVGESALSANCGDGNTALGREALKVATGTYNTSVGYQTGDNITDGSYNILVGAGCVPSGASAEVQIVMGANATGVANGNFTIGNGSTDSNLVLGATTWTAPSDSRMKEDVATSTAGISFVNDLRPVTYKWKKEKDLPDSMDAYVEGSEKRVINDKTNHGFIAQEVKSAIDAHPEIKDGFDMWMEKDSDGQQRVAPSALIPILTKAIQEQQALIESLTARIETLEG